MKIAQGTIHPEACSWSSKIQEMGGKAVRTEPLSSGYVPDCLKMHEMCNEAVENEPDNLKYVPDHFKMQKMCDKVVKDGSPIFVEHVPDWLITKPQRKVMSDHCNNIWFIKQYRGYEK